MTVLTPEYHAWPLFLGLMEGPEGCDFHLGSEHSGGGTWRCNGGWDKRYAWQVLTEHFPSIDRAATMDFFEAHGGHCDCEILFNVEDTWSFKRSQSPQASLAKGT